MLCFVRRGDALFFLVVFMCGHTYCVLRRSGPGHQSRCYRRAGGLGGAAR